MVKLPAGQKAPTLERMKGIVDRNLNGQNTRIMSPPRKSGGRKPNRMSFPQRRTLTSYITVVCVKCGGLARLKSVETVMFSNGIERAIYECNCGGSVKRVLPSESKQPLAYAK